MSNKIVLLFTTSVLLASIGIMIIPQASALNPSPVDLSYVTERFTGHTKICGTHICAPGEKTQWQKSVFGLQKISQNKITSATQHGEDVMSKLAGSTSGPTTAHGSVKPTIHTTMPVIGATKNANMTGKGPNNK